MLVSIQVNCNRCGDELDDPGALVFGPPLWGIKVQKRHVCMKCWPKLMRWFDMPQGGDQDD